MKIAIDARFYGPENGGLGRYTMNLIDQLSRIDSKNEYVLLLRAEWFEKLSLPENFKKILVNSKHYSFREQLEIPRTLQTINPDVTHFLHFNVPLFYEGKYVMTIHDLLMHKGVGRSATTLSPLRYKVKRLGYRKVFDHAVKSASQIIVPSKFVSDELITTYKNAKAKVSVIYEGVSYLSSDIVGQKQKNPYFLYVGNAYPHKNIESAIKAIVLFNEKLPKPIDLILVTPRDIFTDRLKEEIARQNAQKFVVLKSLVSDSELFSLYKNSVAFIYPSFSEGFGLQGLEAMHSSTRLIASDIPVFHEIYGQNAFYFDPLSVSDIQKAFETIIAETKMQREKKLMSAKKFSNKYSWEQMARDTLALYAKA